MGSPLKILILEDSTSDADLVIRLLKKGKMHCEFNVATDKPSYLRAFDAFGPDVILSDNSLPRFDSSEALKIARELVPHIPFILVTGTVSEEFAATIIRSGADDYILKDRMARLPSAIDAALAHRQADKDLRDLEHQVLEQKIQEQKKITRAIMNAESNERTHMGQELHDNINQILVAAKLYLSLAGNKNEAVKELIKYPVSLIDDSIREIRLLSQKLVTPVKNINLGKLVRDLLRSFKQHKMMKMTFAQSIPEECLSDDLKLNIYRIIQEQVNNILKYSEAKNVKIVITTAGKAVLITVADDGKGFDVDKKREGIGISNIINRVESFNGKIDIKSAIGQGCTVQLSIPY